MMLLTIVIPTYKRPAELLRLLRWLLVETAPVAGSIRVIISDNASPCGVSADVIDIVAAHPWMTLFQQRCNVGPDQNFMDAVDRVATPYFWLLGDDDLMVTGLLKQVLAYLKNHEPDLIYLPSYWTTDDLAVPARALASHELQFFTVDTKELATHCHVNLTFISSWIVKRTHWQSSCGSSRDPNALVRTNLLQMAWMLQALIQGSQFAIADNVCIVASSGNTGGYKLLTVFGKNLREILTDQLNGRREILDLIVNRLGWTYLPSLIWFGRTQHGDDFLPEDYEAALILWRSEWAYKLIQKPMLTLPKRLAFLLFVLVKFLDRMWTITNRFRYTLTRIKS